MPQFVWQPVKKRTIIPPPPPYGGEWWQKMLGPFGFGPTGRAMQTRLQTATNESPIGQWFNRPINFGTELPFITKRGETTASPQQMLESIALVPMVGEMMPIGGVGWIKNQAQLAKTAKTSQALSKLKARQKQFARIGEIEGIKTGEAMAGPKPSPVGVSPEAEKPIALLPSRTFTKPTITYEQLSQAHQIKAAKNLSGAGYRRLAKALTGKTSMKYMTQEDGNLFIESLNRLTVRNGKAVVSKSRAIIPEALANKVSQDIPVFKEIGIIDKLRSAWKTWLKIGLYDEIYLPTEAAEVAKYEYLVAMRQQLDKYFKLVNRLPESAQRIFKALDNPLESHLLNEKEQEAYLWFRKWADAKVTELKIPVEKIRGNYIPHIFDAKVKEIGKIPEEFLAALDINPSPAKTIFMPFMKERLGANVGLVEDPFRAVWAYEKYASRQLFYQPLITRIRELHDYLPRNSKAYLRNYLNRLINRPTLGDNEMNQSLKEMADTIKKMPGGEKLGKILGLDNKGNLAAVAAHTFNSILYTVYLGLRPASAILNLFSHTLTFAMHGSTASAKGLALRFTAEGKEALKHSITLKTRQMAYLPGVDEAVIKTLPRKTMEFFLSLFRMVENKLNVPDAFLVGYAKGKELGLPAEWAYKYGDETVRRTQFMYTRMARSMLEEHPVGRFLSPFTSWPRNWLDLMSEWVTGAKSPTLQAYAYEMTQKGLTNPAIAQELARKGLSAREPLLRYLFLLTIAFGIEKSTKVRATEYLGWTTLQNIANMIGGSLPALSIPAGIAQVVAGAATGDSQMLKKGWNQARPDNWILIAKQIERVANGEADWLSLFIYLNKEAKKRQQFQWQSPAGTKGKFQWQPIK